MNPLGVKNGQTQVRIGGDAAVEKIEKSDKAEKVEKPAEKVPAAQASFAQTDVKPVIGQVASKDPPQATVRTVAAYHTGEKPASQAEKLLDQGFSADQMAGGHTRALKLYAQAAPLLRAEIAEALGDARLAEHGMTKEALAGMSNDGALKWFLSGTGSFEALDPALQTATLKYLNRMGLALKHSGDAGSAAVYCAMAAELSPKYGPALYNLACATLFLEDANGPTDTKARTKEALDWLEKAIGADPAFFKKRAIEDIDWNPYRSEPRFRALTGLAP